MINEIETRIGMNKTGIAMSPKEAAKMTEGAERLTPVDPGNLQTIGENRVAYMREADPLGSVPMPATLRGAALGLKGMIKQGNNSFIDKLGERLAFERTGTRLYEALLSKWDGTDDKTLLPPLEMLIRFRDEERSHFRLLWQTIEELGADPTAVTPSADNAGVASMGLVQVVTDPRTSFSQAMEAILIAELADHDCWDTLARLADGVGADEAARRFRQALEEEAFHLLKVREWVQNLLFGQPSDYDLKDNRRLAGQARQDSRRQQHLG